MKKMSKIVAIAVVVSVMFASCGLFGGKKGTCPAYNKTESFEKKNADLVNH
jgi:hypothetical protein